DFLMDYGKAVDEYSNAIDKGEKEKSAELEIKIKTMMSKWMEMKVEMGSELTPRQLNIVNQEYKDITEKYQNLAQK
ncbi:MAG: hypothetical protein HKO91_08060, partial [Desulfobacterales bacterium]|nr:hypothetical protein [Desulfobacterales bacterium]